MNMNFKPVNDTGDKRPNTTPQNEYVRRQQELREQALRISRSAQDQADPWRKLTSNMAVQQLVHDFNDLTRQEFNCDGTIPNNWSISIRHVAIQPESDVLFLVAHEGQFVHAIGPARLLHITDANERANIVVPMLLKAFVMSFDTNTGYPGLAPWEWNIRESMLAQSLQSAFRALNIRLALQKIQVSTTQQNAICDREWVKFRDTLMKTVQTPPARRPTVPSRKRARSF